MKVTVRVGAHTEIPRDTFVASEFESHFSRHDDVVVEVDILSWKAATKPATRPNNIPLKYQGVRTHGEKNYVGLAKIPSNYLKSGEWVNEATLEINRVVDRDTSSEYIFEGARGLLETSGGQGARHDQQDSQTNIDNLSLNSDTSYSSDTNIYTPDESTSTIYCRECSFEISEPNKASFCPNCGTRISEQ